MTPQEKNYKVKERVEELLSKYGTIEKTLAYLKAELSGFESSWSSYSSDCLGHGITCNRLMINYIEKL